MSSSSLMMSQLPSGLPEEIGPTQRVAGAGLDHVVQQGPLGMFSSFLDASMNLGPLKPATHFFGNRMSSS
jgi:hypothetical protein